MCWKETDPNLFFLHVDAALALQYMIHPLVFGSPVAPQDLNQRFSQDKQRAQILTGRETDPLLEDEAFQAEYDELREARKLLQFGPRDMALLDENEKALKGLPSRLPAMDLRLSNLIREYFNVGVDLGRELYIAHLGVVRALY